MKHNYGLIGKNISYSFSRDYFADKFRKLNLDDHIYQNFDLQDIGEIHKVLRDTPNLKGLNVTIPYKEAVMTYLDELDPVAAQIGAVNTIRLCNGKLTGYNTDAYGFEHSLIPHLTTSVKNALVLGTGGASKAVIHTLEKLGIHPTTVSRTPGPGRLTYAEINESAMAENLLIVNCTPVGTFPNIEDKPELPYKYLTKNHVLYDLIYNPEQTAFLREGAQRGCTTANGYKMLVLQAEKAWKIWNK